MGNLSSDLREVLQRSIDQSRLLSQSISVSLDQSRLAVLSVSAVDQSRLSTLEPGEEQEIEEEEWVLPSIEIEGLDDD